MSSGITSVLSAVFCAPTQFMLTCFAIDGPACIHRLYRVVQPLGSNGAGVAELVLDLPADARQHLRRKQDGDTGGMVSKDVRQASFSQSLGGVHKLIC